MSLTQRLAEMGCFEIGSEESQLPMARNTEKIQLGWGVLLVLAGIGVFFRIPQVMPKIEQIDQFASVTLFIKFCFYLMGALLIGGGLKKIFENYQKEE